MPEYRSGDILGHHRHLRIAHPKIDGVPVPKMLITTSLFFGKNTF